MLPLPRPVQEADRCDLDSAIEATCHAPSWEGVYGEIFKVLKPGGTVRHLRVRGYLKHQD